MVSINRYSPGEDTCRFCLYIPLWYLLIGVRLAGTIDDCYPLHSTMVSINHYGYYILEVDTASLHSTMVSINPQG